MEENSDVLCINCENMISLSKIEAHSSVCIEPTSQVINFTCSNYLSLLHFRITKLKTNIEALVYYDPHLIQPMLKDCLIFLIAKSNELLLLSEITMESVDKATAINSQLRGYCSKIPFKYTIYLERLRMLSLEKTYLFLDSIGKLNEQKSLNQLLSKNKSELNSVRKQMSKNKTLNDDRMPSLESVDDSRSIVEPRFSIRSSIVSPMEKENSGLKGFESHYGVSTGKVIDEMKKVFYSKCLIVKLSFSSRHPAQYIQIQELYEKIISNSIPMDKWEDSIREEFNHPERWVNVSVIPK